MNELHAHEATFVKTNKVYGSSNQLYHGVEELLELAAALLKLQKRSSAADRVEVVKEFTDVLIQMPIILENLQIFDAVKEMIPQKIKRAEEQVLKHLNDQ